VKQKDGLAVRAPDLDLAYVKDARLDLLELPEGWGGHDPTLVMAVSITSVTAWG
jgi:hypothetical protein